MSTPSLLLQNFLHLLLLKRLTLCLHPLVVYCLPIVLARLGPHVDTLVQLYLCNAQQVVLNVIFLSLLLVLVFLVLLNNSVEVVFIKVMQLHFIHRILSKIREYRLAS